MRTREQFKAYVYEKAAAEKLSAKRSRTVWMRTAATCSLLLIIGGAIVYSGIGINDTAEVMAPDAVECQGNYVELYRYVAEEECVVENDSVEYSDVEQCETVLADDYKAYSSTFLCNEATACESGTGVKTEAFKVASEFDALELAKKECTVEYDSYTVAYDEEKEIWRVVFYMANTAGGDQTVYIGIDGTIKKIVYGE